MDISVKKVSKKQNRTIAAELINVNKSYVFHHEKPTLVESLLSFGKNDHFDALSNINLTIYKGEKVGIIGHNGSGKTTVLKVISKITSPTSGIVKTDGKVVSLIELTAGFHPDLTGSENIYLNGLIVGMSRSEVKERYDEIANFAGIGDFINSPLYTYSDGMKLRLGFSIAINSDPDILILDEGIAAGDKDFQLKSGEKIKELFRQKKTVIIVSHWLDYLRDHCDKFILIERGQIKKIGGKEILKKYDRNFV